MVIIQKTCQGKFQPTILGKTGHPRYQASGIAVGSTNIFQNVLGGLFLQLYVASFGHGDKSIFNLSGYAASGIGQQGCKLFFKAIALVGLTDKVQYCQAFLTLRKPQTTAELLKENCQGLGWPQKQHSVDLRDVHALVVDVHHKDEANLTAHQPPFGSLSLLIGGFSGQENRRDSSAVKIAAHKLRMLNGDAEA